METKEITKIQESISPIVSEAKTYTVTTPEEVDQASLFLKKVTDTLRAVETKRLSFTAPLNQSLKEINSTFKQISAPLEEAKSHISKLIIDWRREEQARIVKEEERRRHIQDAHAEQGHNVNDPVTMARPDNTIGNASTRKIWRFKITDFSKVPDEFKTINQVAVNMEIRNGKRAIPGLEIYQEETLAVIDRKSDEYSPF